MGGGEPWGPLGADWGFLFGVSFRVELRGPERGDT